MINRSNFKSIFDWFKTQILETDIPNRVFSLVDIQIIVTKKVMKHFDWSITLDPLSLPLSLRGSGGSRAQHGKKRDNVHVSSIWLHFTIVRRVNSGKGPNLEQKLTI